GTDPQFQAAVFDMYPATLRSSVLWPTLGNHDGMTADSATGTGPYYDIFTLPKAGQAGGLSSGTEAYYSFDYGNIHFVTLESFETNRSTNGAMLTWLQQDLSSTNQPWLIVFFHHPPYTKGSHNSDVDVESVEMRQNALPILEDAGVDLVLTGHSHSYERSYLIDGHYGTSGTFTAGMKVDGGNGRESGTGAYQKPAGLASHAGAVYAVAGSSGKIGGGTLNHPAMVVSLNSLGSMVLDVDDGRLDAVFLDSSGVTRDSFTILKGSVLPAPPEAPTGLTAGASGTSITLGWTDNATNEDGFNVERALVGGSFAQIATPGANTTGLVDSGLSAGTTYRYRVQAWNAGGVSAYTSEASATTPAATTVAAPSGLTATARTTTIIDLTWVDQANNETGFEVQRSTNGSAFTTIVTVGANIQAYASTGLAKNKLYYYRVRAVRTGTPTIYSAYSNTASARTLRR
ncbi:MAG: metallophosphoesterase, partial [Vicinamibacteria bacterium]|nr:metallophosphoesterase [Vicinamibacteria bacterium]